MIEKTVRGKRLCPFEALESVKEASREELDDWVELDVVTRYPGDIEAER